MIKAGDKVRVKSLDEVLEIEGVSSIDEVDSPKILREMKYIFDTKTVVDYVYTDGDLRVSGANESWAVSPKWVELVDELEELIKYTEELDLKVEGEYSTMTILTKRGEPMVRVYPDSPLALHIEYASLTDEQMRKLIDLVLDYSSTLTRKYYLRLPDGYSLVGGYLNYVNGEYIFADRIQSNDYKTQFTQYEIDNLPGQEFVKGLVKIEV